MLPVAAASRAIESSAMSAGWILNSKRRHSFPDTVVSALGHVGCLHFEQGHQERERRFRSLVFIDAIGMKSVSASAGCCIVERHLQIVLAEKPAEDATALPQASALLRQPVYLKTGGDGGAGFDGLLIEARLLFAFGEESAGADGHKNLFVAAVLRGDKPLRATRFPPRSFSCSRCAIRPG